ncbi:MAG: MerC domain-containing protein [Bacteroidota bacterium]
MNPTNRFNYADWVGMVASGLCTLHCILTPVIFAAKPFFVTAGTGHTHGPALWSSLDYVFLFMSLMAVWYAVDHAATSFMKAAFWLFWGIFAFGLFMEGYEIQAGKWLMYAGSIALIVMHFLNYRHYRQHLLIFRR